MTRLAEIQTHIASMGELLDIVGAMRSLAGMRVQEAHRALPGVRRYADAMASAIGGALLLTPEPVTGARSPGARRALVLCASEHGFVGGFNERLLDAAETGLAARDALFVLGTRGAALAQERGRPTAWTHSMATRLAGIPEAVRRLAGALYRRVARGELARAEVMFVRYRHDGTPTIERRLLFPLDLARLAAPARLPPLHNLPPGMLLEKLLAEYVFALLTEAAVESLASENAARLSAMEAAHDNVSKKLDALRQDARRARQNEITTELLDLVTGAEALSGARARP
ncbi:MAG TPA: FoF1 ATP synthase subunit gamma [Casimicrobiaceae bacterium]